MNRNLQQAEEPSAKFLTFVAIALFAILVTAVVLTTGCALNYKTNVICVRGDQPATFGDVRNENLTDTGGGAIAPNIQPSGSLTPTLSVPVTP